jgi:hypothetical protein
MPLGGMTINFTAARKPATRDIVVDLDPPGQGDGPSEPESLDPEDVS